MASFTSLLSTILLLSFLCFTPSPVSASNKVSVSLYYEALCPYCSDFIVNNLAKIFQNGLISIVDLSLVPFGNAVVTSDGSIICQHGKGECLLNAIEACAIRVWPDVQQHFPFIQCVEKSVEAREENGWRSCFQATGLSSEPIVNCYNSGYGQQLELQYAKETNSLQPPRQFVPWVLVNGQPLYEDYEKFEHYICKAYNGVLPKVCKGQRLTISEQTRANNGDKVCRPGKNLT
ncbi:gamma-interferon-inducible lysosomal thiol reductase-like isoform X2 [Carex littledalei]|uniref:Gamma-interferon-inducible lysosomal thiol reductase-like isoform X2 n=1 Tax=Carex littledalei TaxID=544730 RepID=A0A833VA77_9POAL|nr:gamma-interferon-inducible lysosomal thiol reductase-like isoform X2 [Carex littledalei]